LAWETSTPTLSKPEPSLSAPDIQNEDSEIAVAPIAIIAITIFIIILALFGIVKTFKRQPVVAILCVIFLTPIYVIWAFCELFTQPISKK